jgi:hypothetical protein
MVISPLEFYTAVDLFNQQQFFECHEVLEELWRPLPPSELKTFYQGLLQVGIGFHHLRNGNRTGAKNLLTAGLEKLTPLVGKQPFENWLDLSKLIAETQPILNEIQDIHYLSAEFTEREVPQITLVSQ